MKQRKSIWLTTLQFLLISSLLPIRAFAAYNGSDAWLHYALVPDDVKGQYQNVCKSLVLSDPASDTLKNAQAEFDLAIPGLLGGSKLPVADGAGAIVLAPQGSDLLASAGIDFSKVTDEGFIIKSSGGKTFITGKNQIGVLRGAFHFIRLMQTGKPIENLDIVENPYFPYRVLDHWINHYGSNVETERVYGGGRVFKMEDFGNLSGTEKTRVINYCRMAVSLGLNGICPDNVNTYRSGTLGNYKCLEESNLKNEKVFADLIGTYGLKYYLSVSYASPKLVSPKTTSANAYGDASAKKWWVDKVNLISTLLKNFGGFLMKADSEGEEGPRSTYNLNQSQGANPIADALKQHGYILIWRTFIYDASDSDFAKCQSKEFTGQTWDDAVVLRTKDGPRDFQTVEPPNQLLGMGGVRHGMEFEITQEYTGQAIHLNWLVPKWKQVLDWDIKGASLAEGTAGSLTHQILRGDGTAAKGGGVWAISNLSDTVNWTGQFLAQANYYGYGRLAWNPTLSAEQIADEWIRCSFDKGYNPALKFILWDMLSKSWKTYEDYTISYSALMPALENDNHYEISFAGMKNSRFFTEYFMHFTDDGIGVDRTTATGNKGVSIYPKALADSFENINTCPEEYLLFFHHCQWEYKMKSGMTLIQSLYYNHFRGLRQVRNFINNWKLMSDLVDPQIYSHVLGKLNLQYTDAKRWVNTFKTDFGAKYSTAVGCDLGIVVPDSTKATTVDKGSPVALSVKYNDQKGKAVTESFKWSVSNGGTLSAAEGTNVTFSAQGDGVYEVTVSTATFPDLKDKIQIFVGDWKNTTTRTIQQVKKLKAAMNITQNQFGIFITASKAGKIDIIGLQGKLFKTMEIKAGNSFMNTQELSRGLYLMRFKNKTTNQYRKLILR